MVHDVATKALKAKEVGLQYFVFETRMISTGCSPLQVIDNADNNGNEEDTIILLGCKLIVSAAGVIVSRRRHQGARTQRGRTTIFCVRNSVAEISRGLGDRYFRRAYVSTQVRKSPGPEWELPIRVRMPKRVWISNFGLVRVLYRILMCPS